MSQLGREGGGREKRREEGGGRESSRKRGKKAEGEKGAVCDDTSAWSDPEVGRGFELWDLFSKFTSRPSP